ncbi:MAG TPA: DUF2059 domain-containing protein, partial [Candidatus Methylomirabilis sp.]|nr:DUF2059 domain-containing protein [Candidatus Methylomirabilis sp.]
MRKSVWQWALFLSLLAVVPQAYAQDEAAIQELYVKSGLEKQLAQLPLVIQAALDQAIVTDPHADQLPPQMGSVMKALAPKAFALDTLKTVVLASLKDQLTTDDTTAVLEWLNSPLGRKCTQLEETAFTPAALAEILQYAARVQESPPSTARLQIIRQLDAALKATESSVEMAINMQLALSLAIRESYPRELQRPVDDILRDLEETRPSLESVVRSQTL